DLAETAAVAGGGQTIDHRHLFRGLLVGGNGPAGARRAGLRILGFGGALIAEGGKNLAFGAGAIAAVRAAIFERRFAGFRRAAAIDVDADRVTVFGDVAGDAERHGAFGRGALRPSGDQERATRRRQYRRN